MSGSSRAVFLSYAREDADAARRIADALRAFGVEVWFDQHELRGGDAWDQKIRQQIKECTLFVPIVSARTDGRREGYFRREWKLAAERTADMGRRTAFLVPVVVDDTPESAADVPEEFVRVQWTRLEHGVPSPEFVAQVRRLLESPKTLNVGRGFPTPPGFSRDTSTAGSGDPALQRNRRRWLVRGAVVVALLAVVGVTVWQLRSAGGRGLRPVSSGHGEATRATPNAAAQPPLAFANAKSIAVLPFDNRSSEADTAFFTDGVHEDVVTNLALVRELRVIPRTSVAQYRGTTKSIRQIGQELGVAFVLTGSVQRAGGKVRVTGQLINARSEDHVSTLNYLKDLTDVFAIQAEIAQAIAGALKAALSPEEKKMLERRPTENVAAYDLYLQARELLRAPGGTGTSERQVTLLQTAVELDSKFAAAWAHLCFSHGWLYFFDRDHTPDRKARARSAMERAIKLAPDSVDARRARGAFLYYCESDFARAAEEYRAIVEQQPSDSDALQFVSVLNRRMGRWVEATAASRKVLELDPGNLMHVANFASSLEAGRRYEEAGAVRDRLVRMLNTGNDSIQARFNQARLAFFRSGSTREVAAFLASLTPEELNSPRGLTVRRRWAHATGKTDELLALRRPDAASGAELEDVFVGAREWAEVAFAPVISLLAQGRAEEARALLPPVEPLRAEVMAQPDNVGLRGRLSTVEALLGNKESAIAEAKKALELRPEAADAVHGALRAHNLAFVYAWSGEKDLAIAEYARLLRHPGAGLNVHEMKLSPRYHPLRGDPRFEALLNDPKNNQPLF